MKIAFLCYNLSDGGAQRVVSVLSNAMTGRHEILVILKERCENEYVLNPEVSVRVLDEDPRFFAARKKDIAAVSAIRRILKAEKPDFLMGFLGFLEAGYLACRGLSTRYLMTIRNSPWSKPENRIKRMTRDLTVMLSDACMVQNQEQATYFPKWVQKKCFAISNPVDPAYAACGDHAYGPVRRIITLGRLHAQKNHEMMLDAFASVQGEIPQDVMLEIYGNGDKKPALEHRIRELSLDGRVKILPFQAKPLSIYQAADLFLLSSDFEGMPNALLEAMTVGLPCISTDCRTGPKDMIRDGENGFLVPVGDTEAMARRLLQLIRDPAEAERLGKAARKTVLDYWTQDRITEQLEQKLRTFLK